VGEQRPRFSGVLESLTRQAGNLPGEQPPRGGQPIRGHGHGGQRLGVDQQPLLLLFEQQLRRHSPRDSWRQLVRGSRMARQPYGSWRSCSFERDQHRRFSLRPRRAVATACRLALPNMSYKRQGAAQKGGTRAVPSSTGGAGRYQRNICQVRRSQVPAGEGDTRCRPRQSRNNPAQILPERGYAAPFGSPRRLPQTRGAEADPHLPR
jgi:hypothetical protein